MQARLTVREPNNSWPWCWARQRSHCRGTVRARGWIRNRAWKRRSVRRWSWLHAIEVRVGKVEHVTRRSRRTRERSNARPRCWRLTRNRCAPRKVDGVNAPAFAGATRIAGHPPAQPCTRGKDWQVDHGRDEALRVTAPSLTTCDRATSIGADCAIIAALNEGPTRVKNILERVSTVKADLQHSAVKAQIRIDVRCFKVEVLVERQLQWVRRRNGED